MVIHRCGIKHQAADAFLKLSTTGKDEDGFNEKLPLRLIDHAVNQNASNYPSQGIDHLDEHINNAKATMDQQTYDSPTLVKIVHAQKNNVCCRTSISQVSHGNG